MSTTTIHKLPGTYGLVVCGGKSSRMNSDKSMLSYYGKPQRYHVYEMLQPFCEKVFISCNKEQAGSIETGYDLLTDDVAYEDTGPMAALLTAFDQFPGKNILFIGCDYPFLSDTELREFSATCKDQLNAVAFFNEAENIYEPLLSWYPASRAVAFKTMHQNRQYSLQQCLQNSSAVKYHPHQVKSIQSIDTMEAFLQAHKIINP